MRSRSVLQKRMVKAHASDLDISADSLVMHTGGFKQLSERIEELL